MTTEHQNAGVDKNTAFMAALAVTEAVQALIFFSVLLSFVPIDSSPMMGWVFDKDRFHVKPDWKVFIYRLSVAVGLIGAGAALKWRGAWLKNPHFTGSVYKYLISAWGVLFFQLYAAFFILSKSPGNWAWPLLAGGMAAAMLLRVFWPEWRRVINGRFWMAKIIVVAMAAAVLVDVFYLGGFQVGAQALLCLAAVGMALGFIWLLIKSRFWLLPGPSQPPHVHPIVIHLTTLAFAIAVVALVAVVDPLAVVAKTAFGEHFYHFDFMLMASTFAVSMGNVMGVDHLVFYGLGLPVFMAWLTKLLWGRVDYVHVFITYWALCVLYFVALFFCLRFWFKSVLVAAAATLLAIKWQLFYSLAYPVTAIYPNSSVLRCLLDIPIFTFLYLYLKSRRTMHLLAAVFLIGAAITYVPTTGVDLYMALTAYLLAFLLIPDWRKNFISKPKDWLKTAMVWVLPLVFAFVFLWLICGQAVWGLKFWQDLMYYPSLFTNGFYTIAFEDNLKVHQYWNFAVSCAIPLIYLATVIWTGMRLFLGRADPAELIVLVVSVYGLSLFHHYVTLALANNYYMRAIPFVFVLFYWINSGLRTVKSGAWRLLYAWGIFVLCLFALLTNRLYLAHPNLLNRIWVANPMVDPRRAYPLPEDGRPYFFHNDAWVQPENKLPFNSLGNTEERVFWEWQVPDHKALKQIYKQEFNFEKDTQLIQSLTAPQEKAALISSFEIEMLIQAERRPFFFYFPMVSSRGLNIRTFPHTNIYTKTMLERTIADLEQSRPEYIFMERIFLNRRVPASYFKDHEELVLLLNYVNTHYRPYRDGQFLVAMRRNP